MDSVFTVFKDTPLPDSECGFNYMELGIFSQLATDFDNAEKTRCASCPTLQSAGREALNACLSYGLAYHEGEHELEDYTSEAVTGKISGGLQRLYSADLDHA